MNYFLAPIVLKETHVMQSLFALYIFEEDKKCFVNQV